MSQAHPQQWEVNEVDVHVGSDVIEGFRELPTTLISDSGGPVSVASPEIRHIAGPNQTCGTAVTVWTRPGDFLFVLKAVDLVSPGDVLVIDGGGIGFTALIGDLLGGALQRNGGVGLVVDGMVRDVHGLDEIGLPTFARGSYPSAATKLGPGAVNVPVQLAGATVRPGDVIRVDQSGIVAIPARHAADVLHLTREAERREAGWVELLASGSNIRETFDVQ
jgi:4-hydroxy-4-methyl-2-oxoglutarate aldolase